VHQDADNIAVAVEHFVLVLKEVDAETFQAVRQIMYRLSAYASQKLNKTKLF